MNGSETALSLLWVAVGIIAAFFAWNYVQTVLPASA